MSEQQARLMLRDGAAAGAVLVERFRVLRQGTARTVPHYAAK